MKKLSKVKLDELIALIHEYHENFINDEAWYGPILRKRTEVAQMLSDENWLYLTSVVEGGYGLNREITNEDIYRVLELLGWQVVSDDAGDD